jgi:hypothetical protein
MKRRLLNTLAATILMLAATHAVAADPASPETKPAAPAAKKQEPKKPTFDVDLKVVDASSKDVKFEKPAPPRDFIDRIGIYLRAVPTKGNKAFPVFVSTRNYLVCPDNPKKYYLNDVKQANFDKRSGVRILGFFFDKPPCEKATQYLEATTGEV